MSSHKPPGQSEQVRGQPLPEPRLRGLRQLLYYRQEQVVPRACRSWLFLYW